MKKIINGFLTVFLIFACQNVLAEPFKIHGADFTRDEKGSEFYEKTIVAIENGCLSERGFDLFDGLERVGSCDFA